MSIAARLLTVIWIGSLWTVGYVVAPTLFAVLDDRALAGQVAGQLFTIESYLSLICGGALLLGRVLQRSGGRRLDWLGGVLLAMLVLILIGQFVLQPQMVELKRLGANHGADFARLHGVSSLLYMAVSLLGLVWVLFSGRGAQGN